MVHQSVMGVVPEVCPRTMSEVVLGRGQKASRGRSPGRGTREANRGITCGVGKATRGRETSHGTQWSRESSRGSGSSWEKEVTRRATPSSGAAESTRHSLPRVSPVVPAFGRVLRSTATQER